jgi:hypothetical protein
MSMIPSDFSDYFKNCAEVEQQSIIDELLKMSASQGAMVDNSDAKAILCPHCQGKSIRGNGKLKGVQRYVCKSCAKNFSETTGKFWFALKKFDFNTIMDWLRLYTKPLQNANWTVIALCVATAATFWFFNALNKVYTTRIDYPIQLRYDRDSLVMVKEPPRKVPINVTGGGWQLLKRTVSINAEPIFLEPEKPAQTRSYSSARLLPIISEQLTDLNVNYVATDSISFRIEPYADRKLAIDLDSASISLRQNFSITSPVAIEPDSVVFHGPLSMVNQLPEVFMVSLDEEEIDDGYDEELSLDLFSNSIIKKQPEVVHITFSVEEFVDQSIMLDIEKVNFPFDSTVYLQQGQTEVQFVVPKTARNRYEKSDFMIIADLKYMQESDSTIALEIMDQPEYVRDLELINKRVKVIYAPPAD